MPLNFSISKLIIFLCLLLIMSCAGKMQGTPRYCEPGYRHGDVKKGYAVPSASSKLGCLEVEKRCSNGVWLGPKVMYDKCEVYDIGLKGTE